MIIIFKIISFIFFIFFIFSFLVLFCLFKEYLKQIFKTKETILSLYRNENYTCFNLTEWEFVDLISKKYNYYNSKFYISHSLDEAGYEVITKIDFDGPGNNTLIHKCCIASHQSNLYLYKKNNSTEDWFFLIFDKKPPTRFTPKTKEIF